MIYYIKMTMPIVHSKKAFHRSLLAEASWRRVLAAGALLIGLWAAVAWAVMIP